VRRSTRAVVLVGVFYAVIGIVFAWPENHVRVWRLAAWLVSAAAYATHIGYESFRTRATPGGAALRVALAVALGAFGLALSATIHSFLVAATGQHRRLVLLALAIWPIMTGLPAFLVALAASAMLARLRWKARTGSRADVRPQQKL
jgi:hypothetical protein